MKKKNKKKKNLKLQTPEGVLLFGERIKPDWTIESRDAQRLRGGKTSGQN